MLGMASSPVTARPRMTISISSRRYRNTSLCEHIYQRYQERLGDVHARVVLCGHSHQQHLIQLPNGPLVLNPGSVGCPAYDDPGADPHVSESGSPYARYAVLSIDEQNASADMIALTYDWKAASARAEKPPDWPTVEQVVLASGPSPTAGNRRATLMCARFVSSRGARNDWLPQLLRLPAVRASAPVLLVWPVDFIHWWIRSAIHLMILPKVGGDFRCVTSAAYLGHSVVIFSINSDVRSA